MASIGWCPQYTVQSCDFTYADDFCQKNYGGQLISIEGQVPRDAGARRYRSIRTPGTPNL